MRKIVSSLLILLVYILGFSNAQAQSDPVNEIIQRVNALRAAYGVPAYQVENALMLAAQAQANWSAENNHFGHDGPGGSSPDDRAKAAGYGGGVSSYAIENVAHGTASINTPELVVTMWQNDWGHLNAMISADYEHIGVGYAEANGFSWYVMMVGWVGAKASSGEPQVQGAPPGENSSAPFVLSEPDESGAIYHEVQQGQTAWTIAALYGIDLAELFRLNNLTEDSILHPGDVLMIRPPDVPTNTPTHHSIAETPTRTAAKTQTAEVSIVINTLPSSTASALPEQSGENGAESSSSSDIINVLLFSTLGAVLLISVIIIITARRQSSSDQT